MTREDAQEWTESLGQVVAGSWRQIALAKRLGVPKALGLTVEEWVSNYLGGYIKLSIPERQEAVKELASEGLSQREMGSVLGVREATINRDMATVTNGTAEQQTPNDLNNQNDKPVPNVTPIDAVAALAANDKIRTEVKARETRIANEEQRKTELERPVNVVLAPGLYHGDFRELSDQIRDTSIDLVFTDPPYKKDSIGLYGDAARVAARILKPGGSFIAYSGQRHLPQVLAECSVYLDYWWMIAGLHAGGNQMLKKLGLRCGWKPLIWFVKGTRGDVSNVLIDVVSGGREKGGHEWQQAEEEARYYIDKLTTVDGWVVDFFVGSGTSAAAAKKLGRHWIGFEIEAASAEGASRRIMEAT